MSTKKVYVEMVQYLESNSDKLVSEILNSEEFKDIITAKKQSNCVLKDENDNVVAIFCYYHKQWELLSEVDYGSKASSATGYNTMCKNGVNHWTKQQNEAKKAKAELLDQVATGEVKPDEIAAKLDEIENERNKIDMSDAPKGSKKEPKVA